MRVLSKLAKIAGTCTLLLSALEAAASTSGSHTTADILNAPLDLNLLWLPGALLVYYLIAWVRVGRGPAPGPIVAHYEPPANMSPAEARYLFTGTSDYKTVAAVLAHL